MEIPEKRVNFRIANIWGLTLGFNGSHGRPGGVLLLRGCLAVSSGFIPRSGSRPPLSKVGGEMFVGLRKR